MCTFLHVNKPAARLALVHIKRKGERHRLPAGLREKSTSNEKKAARKLSHLKSEPAAQVAFEVRVVVTVLSSHQPLGSTPASL